MFSSELAWRDFYADVLFQRPETAWENLNPKYDDMAVDTDADAGSDSTGGRRGDRVRDRRAGMRQLAATGLDAQPGADDRRQLPRQGPPPPLAVGAR